MTTHNIFSIEGKVALVTGASRGIGAAIANGMADAGAIVTAIARSETAAEPLRENIQYQCCDIADDDQFKTVCKSVYSEHNKIDILVNAAGVSIQQDSSQPLVIFDKTLNINLRAAYACCVAVNEFMAQEGGAIINITSINSIMAFPDNPAYVAAKGGLKMLTKALALDYGKNNIRVNAIAPGYIHTRMTDKSFSDPALHKQRLAHMILPRWGQPEDIVGGAIFLASDASSYITGQEIVIDGGWTTKGLVS